MMDILTTVLPLAGGGLFGALMTLWGNAQKDKADNHARTMEALTAHNDRQIKTNQTAVQNKGFAWTRRIIALSITSVVVGAFWMGTPVTVPIEIVEGTSYIFGLIDDTTTTIGYKELDGAVILPDVLISFKAIIGAYFGSSMVRRT